MLEADGAVIVEQVLEPDLVRRFNSEIEPLLADASPSRAYINPAIEWFYGDRVRQVVGMAAKSRIFAEEVLCHPLYEGLCSTILGPHCASVQLNVAQVMERGPGAEQQALHRDEDVWIHLPRPHPEVQLASVIALVDFRADNGATVVVPGSHRWPRDRRPDTGELVAADMTAGSAVVYLGSTVHGGGANTTPAEHRRGMHMSFCVGWLRPEENHYLSTPLDVARTLPPRTLQLLGYSAHDAISSGGGYLGAVDLLDPLILLQKGEI